jgi:8-oxo-dGTP diphosphatase
MTVHDGNGWTRCGLGHRHWGRHGAAGLLVVAGDQVGGQPVLLQLRSWWSSHGGSWGLPGGARDSHESPVRAALREAVEECAIDPAAVRVFAVFDDDHGGWTYHTVLAHAPSPIPAAAVSDETTEVAWFPAGEIGRLRLHPGFAEQWPALRVALQPVTVVVDAANVMGSRPDGWWRDRAGAARRLVDQITKLAANGVTDLPDGLAAPGFERWFPRFVVVLEGAASAEIAAPARDGGWPTAPAGHEPVIVRARGSGDDEIVRQAAGYAVQGPTLVVTADRELRSRCAAVSAAVTGPRWLLELL